MHNVVDAIVGLLEFHDHGAHDVIFLSVLKLMLLVTEVNFPSTVSTGSLMVLVKSLSETMVRRRRCYSWLVPFEQ